MSVKAQALVWELECPKEVNGVNFKPSHKFVLIAYADHADHNGKNIYPAVATIAKKTGLDDRTVQRLTRDLNTCGLLVDDGMGPRGTNRWSLPYSAGGDKLTPLTNCQGDKNQESLGDIPSGDIPSGDKLTPELNKPEPKDLINKDKYISILQKYALFVFGNDFMGWNNLKKKLEAPSINLYGDEKSVTVSGLSEKQGQFTLAEVWQDRYGKSFENAGLKITFTE